MTSEERNVIEMVECDIESAANQIEEMIQDGKTVIEDFRRIAAIVRQCADELGCIRRGLL